MKRGWRFRFDGLTVTVFNSPNLWTATRNAAREARYAGVNPTILELERLH